MVVKHQFVTGGAGVQPTEYILVRENIEIPIFTYKQYHQNRYKLSHARKSNVGNSNNVDLPSNNNAMPTTTTSHHEINHEQVNLHQNANNTSEISATDYDEFVIEARDGPWTQDGSFTTETKDMSFDEDLAQTEEENELAETEDLPEQVEGSIISRPSDHHIFFTQPTSTHNNSLNHSTDIQENTRTTTTQNITGKDTDKTRREVDSTTTPKRGKR